MDAETKEAKSITIARALLSPLGDDVTEEAVKNTAVAILKRERNNNFRLRCLYYLSLKVSSKKLLDATFP